MKLHEIVMKLVGPVQPTGDDSEDKVRLSNMKNLADLTDRLLFEINVASSNAERREAAIKGIGIVARDFMNNVKSAYASVTEETAIEQKGKRIVSKNIPFDEMVYR